MPRSADFVDSNEDEMNIWHEWIAGGSGNAFVAKAQERFAYDLDSNLTSDGRWNYYWDAENRLIKMAAKTSVGPQISLQFDYDWKSRRIRKEVWNNTTWGGSPATDLRFVYDGWNLTAELDAHNAPSAPALMRSYVWGPDLSGTPQGAGGVGGLLFVCDAPSAICHCAAFDGNGNVAALVSAGDGTISAQYEYGPFGEVLRAAGPMAKANRSRFSTKYQDDETDQTYYGYRYYSLGAGRWLSPDPARDAASGGVSYYTYALMGQNLPPRPAMRIGLNPYGFVRNSAIGAYDILGLIDVFVFIWDWRGAGGFCGGRVGHAMVKDAGSHHVEVSQFPQPYGDPSHHHHGTNYLYTYGQTINTEGGLPDKLFWVHVPDDDKFAAAVKDHVSRPWWDWIPSPPSETHCARAAYDVLKAGGVPVTGQDTGEILPGTLGDLLDGLATRPTQGEAVVLRIY